jgi:hypothetical protein
MPVERTIVYRGACPRGELVLETQEWTFSEVCILFYSTVITREVFFCPDKIEFFYYNLVACKLTTQTTR